MGAIRFLRDLGAAARERVLRGVDISDTRALQIAAANYHDTLRDATRAERRMFYDLGEQMQSIASVTGKDIDEIAKMSHDDLYKLLDDYADDSVFKLSNGTYSGNALKSRYLDTYADQNFGGELVKRHNEAFKTSDIARQELENLHSNFQRAYGNMANAGKHTDQALGLSDLYGNQQIKRVYNDIVTDTVDVNISSKAIPWSDEDTRKIVSQRQYSPSIPQELDGKMQFQREFQTKDNNVKYRRRREIDEIDPSTGLPTGNKTWSDWEDINEKTYNHFTQEANYDSIVRRSLRVDRKTPQEKVAKGRWRIKTQVSPDTANATHQVNHTTDFIGYDNDIPTVQPTSPLSFRQARRAGREKIRSNRRARDREIAAALSKASVGESDGVGLGGLIKDHPYIAMGIAAGGAAIIANANAERQGSY